MRVAVVHENVAVGFRPAGGLLRDGIAWLRETNERVNGELYLDGIIAALARHGFRTRVIRLDGYVNWGDPDSFAEAAYWEEVFRGPRPHPRRKYPGLSP